MKTTSLFAELIVIGMGALINFVLVLICIFDLKLEVIFSFFQTGNSLLMGVFIFVFAYLLGIVADRIADYMMQHLDNKIRSRFFVDRSQQLAYRLRLYQENIAVTNLIDYGRSRMRICRGWLLNMIVLLVLGNFWLIINPQYQSIKLFLSLNILILISGGITYFAWRFLMIKEYSKIEAIYKVLTDN
ncbi:MAG: hypothetical protein MI974_14015 [Chitinophagales bacterium]|nr:hypothetical protein [Chitinophagales bacterium]